MENSTSSGPPKVQYRWLTTIPTVSRRHCSATSGEHRECTASALLGSVAVELLGDFEGVFKGVLWEIFWASIGHGFSTNKPPLHVLNHKENRGEKQQT